MFLMKRLYKFSQFLTEDAFQWPLFRRHHMNLDTAATQSSRNFKPDKACTSMIALRAVCARAMMARQSASERRE